MLPESIQEQASLYALSLLPQGEEVQAFESLMNVEPEVRNLVASLTEVAVAVVRTKVEPAMFVNQVVIKASLMARIASTPQQHFPDFITAALREAHFGEMRADAPVIFADMQARLQWINPAFTQMCGYTLQEARGRKPGCMLQGADTAPEAVAALRDAVRNRVAVKQTLINYHRLGQPYKVEIDLRPVSNGYIAVERELAIA